MTEKRLRRYIAPNILAMLGTSCYVLADTFFVSVAKGADGITALNLALPIYGIMFAIGSMTGIGSATRYSICRHLGRKDAQDYFSNSIIWTTLISLLVVLVGIFYPDGVMRLMGADEVILEVGTRYMQIVLCMAPCFMLNYTFTAFVRNDGSPKIAMAAVLLSSIFNIIFDYIFMFPMGMGMTGAALATGMSPVISMLICMLHYLSGKNTIRFVLKKPSVRKLLQACSLGIAAFVGEISGGITTMVFNFILLRLVGNIAVAAYGVVANMALVGTSIFNGVAQGLQPLASEARGKSDREAEEKIYRHSLEIGMALAVFLVFAVCFLAPVIVNVFNSEGSGTMADYAVPGLRIYFSGFLLAAVNIIKTGFYSAVGKGKEASSIAVIRGIIAIVIFAFVLSKLFGMTGVWLAFPVTELFTLIISILFIK